MTPMESPNPDRVDAWLAGHADGELDAATRHRVEEWLATDPQAAEILRDQESLSSGNAEFWSAVEPPTVSDAKWDAVCDAISRRCPTPVPRLIESRGWMKGAIGVAIAASIAAVAIYAMKPADEPPSIQVKSTGSQTWSRKSAGGWLLISAICCNGIQ